MPVEREPETRVPVGMDMSIDETGLLLRDGGGFVLRRDAGGDWPLILPRVPVDLVGKRVRVVGERRDGGVVDVEGVQAR